MQQQRPPGPPRASSDAPLLPCLRAALGVQGLQGQAHLLGKLCGRTARQDCVLCVLHDQARCRDGIAHILQVRHSSCGRQGRGQGKGAGELACWSLPAGAAGWLLSHATATSRAAAPGKLTRIHGVASHDHGIQRHLHSTSSTCAADPVVLQQNLLDPDPITGSSADPTAPWCCHQSASMRKLRLEWGAATQCQP